MPGIPLLSPFPGPDLPASSASLFNNYLVAWLSSLERASGLPRFGLGPSAVAAGGELRRSAKAGFDSSGAPIVLGLILSVPL